MRPRVSSGEGEISLVGDPRLRSLPAAPPSFQISEVLHQATEVGVLNNPLSSPQTISAHLHERSLWRAAVQAAHIDDGHPFTFSAQDDDRFHVYRLAPQRSGCGRPITDPATDMHRVAEPFPIDMLSA